MSEQRPVDGCEDDGRAARDFPLSSADSAKEVCVCMSSDPSTAEMVLPSTERGAIRSWLMDMDGVLVH